MSLLIFLWALVNLVEMNNNCHLRRMLEHIGVSAVCERSTYRRRTVNLHPSTEMYQISQKRIKRGTLLRSWDFSPKTQQK